MADTKIVGGKGFGRAEREHKHKDDCDCKVHVNHKTLSGNGTKKHPLNVIGLPNPTPTFNGNTKITIFVRTDGSDKKGTGETPETAFRTLQFAVGKVPLFAAPGVSFFIDITGISEVLPKGYTLPAWKGPQTLFFEFTGQLVLTGVVNIVADLIPVTLIPASDATIDFGDIATVGGFITDASDPASPIVITTNVAHGLSTGNSITISGVTGNDAANGTWFVTVLNATQFSLDGSTSNGTYTGGGVVQLISQDPITGLITLTVAARTSWGLDGLKGKQVIGPDTSVYHPTVVSNNTTTTISLAASESPVFPLTIVEPSATLTSADDAFNFVITAINCDSINFKGIRMLTTSPDAFGSLFIDGSGNAIAQTCELQSPDFQNVASLMTRVISCWCYGFALFGSTGEGILMNHGLMTGLITGFDELGYMTSPAISILTMVFDNCDPIEPIFGIDTHQPSVIASFNMQNTLVKNGTDDGLTFHGGFGLLSNCDISNNQGNGITVNQGAGQLRLENVGSSAANLGAFGVSVTDGMQVSVDVATSTTQPAALRPLTGSASLPSADTSVGSVGGTSWVTIQGALNIPDFTGGAATGARLFQS